MEGVVGFTNEDLEKWVIQRLMKKEYKDQEVYIKSDNEIFEKVIRRCVVYETVK